MSLRIKLYRTLHWARIRARSAEIKLLSASMRLIDSEENSPRWREITAEINEWDLVTRKREEDELHLYVGRALSRWSLLEEAFVRTASILLACDTKKVGTILYSIINFSVWLSTIDELIVLTPTAHPLKKKYWNDIVTDTRKLKDFRDRLGHHTSEVNDGPENATPTLMPGRFDYRSKSQKHKPLSVYEILKFGSGMQDLEKNLMTSTSCYWL